METNPYLTLAMVNGNIILSKWTDSDIDGLLLRIIQKEDRKKFYCGQFHLTIQGVEIGDELIVSNSSYETDLFPRFWVMTRGACTKHTHTHNSHQI